MNVGSLHNLYACAHIEEIKVHSNAADKLQNPACV